MQATEYRSCGASKAVGQSELDRMMLQKQLDKRNFEVNDHRVRVSTQESDCSKYLKQLNDLEYTKDVLPQKTAIRKEGKVCKICFPKDKSKLDLSVLAERCLELVESKQL